MDAEAEHAEANAEHETEAQLAKDLQGKVAFSTTQLPTSVLLTITCMGQLGRDVARALPA